MPTLQQIDPQLVSDVLALENSLREAGLEVHARAVKIALAKAQEDVILEQFYGPDNIINFFKSAENLNEVVNQIIENEQSTNNDMINLLDEHSNDVDNLFKAEKAPSFIKMSSIKIAENLSNLVESLKNKNPDDELDKESLSELIEIAKYTGGFDNE